MTTREALPTQSFIDPEAPANPGFPRHHPDVEQWRSLVDMFFTAAGHPSDIDYALMLMWAESQGRANMVGPSVEVGKQKTRAQGLFGILDRIWTRALPRARQWWQSRGIAIPTDPANPTANVAVASYLRAMSPGETGWHLFASATCCFPPGASSEDTFWDGFRYQNVKRAGIHPPPIGDGRVDTEGNKSPGFVRPVGEEARNPGPSGSFGAPRSEGTRQHAGVDFNAPQGAPIYATASGRVTSAGPGSKYAGNQITLDHGGGWTSFYAHLPENGWLVKPGDVVQQGQLIGYVGDTGNAATSHLHFEIRKGGRAINPVELGVIENILPADRQQLSQQAQDPFMPADREPTTREFASSLLLGTLDTMSRAQAGGQRVGIDTLADTELIDQPGSLTPGIAEVGAGPNRLRPDATEQLEIPT